MTLALVISEAIIAVAAVLTLIALLWRGTLSLEKRLTRLETQIEPFWEYLRQFLPAILQRMGPTGNPVSPERWQYLLSKLQSNTLSVVEARELNAMFLEQQEDAKKKNDLTALIAIGLGLALLAVILKGK